MEMTRTARADQAGFTLIEVLVATSIAAIGFLGLAATHVTALRATVLGRNVSIATNIATEALENLRRQPYDEIASTSATAVPQDGVTFSRQTTVAAIGTTSKKVTMNVSWTDQFGTHTAGASTSPGVQLVTVIGE